MVITRLDNVAIAAIVTVGIERLIGKCKSVLGCRRLQAASTSKEAVKCTSHFTDASVAIADLSETATVCLTALSSKA